MPEQSTADADWVERYRPVLDHAFNVFVETGEWPRGPELRRHFARQGQRVDIELIIRTKPMSQGELRPMNSDALSLRFRQLRYIPQAQPLLYICLTATRRAVEAYLSEESQPKVSSTDPAIRSQAGNDERLLVRAGALLSSETPGPLSGGGYGPDHWEYFINEHSILEFQNVATPDAFIAVQDEIMRRSAQEAAKYRAVIAPLDLPAIGSVFGTMSAEATEDGESPARIFVIMPFQPAWSTPVYDLIKQAILSLALNPEAVVNRADDIAEPGIITEQIIREITAADLIVADITGLNPNVMYELGYAHAMQRPTVLLNQDIGQSPFDISTHRQVGYALTPTADDEQRIAQGIRAGLDL